MSGPNLNLPAVTDQQTNTAILPRASDVVATNRFADTDFDEVAAAGDYLPRLQLCGSNSDACKQGLVPIGNHALFKGRSQIIDLGKNVNCWVIAWRPKALLTSDEKPVSYFDVKSDTFKKIAEEARKPGMNGAMTGPEFLLYIPGQGFCTYFLANKTSKNEAPNFQALCNPDPKCGVISSKYIETKKYSWHGPVIVASSQTFATPPMDEYSEALNNFLNPKDAQVELLGKQEGEARVM